MFSKAKNKILEKRDRKHIKRALSAAMRNLQKRYRKSIADLEKEPSDFNYFATDNLEKLLNHQYKHEKNRKFKTWLRKMNDLDLKNRTRAFFSEIHSRQMQTDEHSPIWGQKRNPLR